MIIMIPGTPFQTCGKDVLRKWSFQTSGSPRNDPDPFIDPCPYIWYQPFYRCREALCNCPNLKRLHMIGDVPDDFDLENFQRTLKAGSSAKELSWNPHPKIDGVYITRNTSTRKSEELNLTWNQSFELKQLYSILKIRCFKRQTGKTIKFSLQVRLGGEPEVCVNCPLGLKIATRSWENRWKNRCFRYQEVETSDT